MKTLLILAIGMMMSGTAFVIACDDIKPIPNVWIKAEGKPYTITAPSEPPLHQRWAVFDFQTYDEWIKAKDKPTVIDCTLKSAVCDISEGPHDKSFKLETLTILEMSNHLTEYLLVTEDGIKSKDYYCSKGYFDRNHINVSHIPEMLKCVKEKELSLNQLSDSEKLDKIIKMLETRSEIYPCGFKKEETCIDDNSKAGLILESYFKSLHIPNLPDCEEAGFFGGSGFRMPKGKSECIARRQK